jgi:hypothetical protein
MVPLEFAVPGFTAFQILPLTKKIRMTTCSFKADRVACNPVYQNPVRFDMAIARIPEFSCQWMIKMPRVQRFLFLQPHHDIPKLCQVFIPFPHSLAVPFKNRGCLDF